MSGRKLCYHLPRLHLDSRYGKQVLKLTCKGCDIYSKKWSRLDTYGGGKLIENIVQDTARDILAYAMKNLEHIGY
ncbi:MAG: hypothetical protein HRT91_04215 [Piscirickettsiaceae bacterium]|nr:hypothetical protein [Piscirickettsiaceae bacterium]